MFIKFWETLETKIGARMESFSGEDDKNNISTKL